MEAVIENTFGNVKTSKERKNKITRDIIDGKYTCTLCCITMKANSYNIFKLKIIKKAKQNVNVVVSIIRYYSINTKKQQNINII